MSNENVINTPEPDLLALGLAYEKLKCGEFSDAINELLTLEKAGSTFAALYLGTIYLNGNGVTVDHEKAENYFRKAAERKNVSAQYNLAVVLSQTDRQKEAMSWYKSAAQLGDASSMFGLYKSYDPVDTSLISKSAALTYLEKSASLGYVFARQALLKLEIRGEYGFMRQLKALATFPFVTLMSVVSLTRKLNSGEYSMDYGMSKRPKK